MEEEEKVGIQKFNDGEIEELIGALQGTTDTMESAINELFGEDYSEDDLTDGDWNKINNSVFLCTDCGWWCETSEESQESLDGEQICEDCNEIR